MTPDDVDRLANDLAADYVKRAQAAEAENERLREQRDNEYHVRCEMQVEIDRLRAALQDAATYLRLGMTWTVDMDRHVKMKAALERAREALR